MLQKKYICLRDDDTNYYTTVEELRTAYGQYWSTLPITLAVIPFVHGSEQKILEVEYPLERKFDNLRNWERNASVEELGKYHKIHPIGENTLLVDEINRLLLNNKIEVAQHGVYHRYTEFGAELLGDRMSFAELRDGKEYLEKVFGNTVHTLIPPGNVIDLTVIEYMNRLEMHLLSSGKIRSRNRLETIKTYLRHPESFIDRRKNSPIPLHHRYGIHYFASHTFEYEISAELILERVRHDLNSCGFSALGTHYRYLLDEKHREDYHKILDSIANIDNICFVTANEYYNIAIQTKS